MSKIVLTFFLTILLSPYSYGVKKEVDFLIMRKSQLLVHGKANIINFTCILKNAFDETPFKMKGRKINKKLHLKEGKIVVPIKNLDCGNNGMNNNMWGMLKAKKYKNIVLDFIEMQEPQWKKSGRFFASSALSKIKITIAGISNIYPIHLNLVKVDEKNFLLSGSKRLRITDFNIKPRDYLFGIIKVKELIEIDFELFLTKEAILF